MYYVDLGGNLDGKGQASFYLIVMELVNKLKTESQQLISIK